MARPIGRPRKPRYLADDLRTLRDRGLTTRQAAHQLGLSVRTAYRILGEQQ